MLNQVILQGTLANAPELLKTRTGVSVSNARIICQRDSYRAGRQNFDIIRLTFWREQADRLCEYYKKGDLISVIGRLEETPRTSKQGIRYNAYNVRVLTIVDPEVFGSSNQEEAEPEPDPETVIEE